MIRHIIGQLLKKLQIHLSVRHRLRQCFVMLLLYAQIRLVEAHSHKWNKKQSHKYYDKKFLLHQAILSSAQNKKCSETMYPALRFLQISFSF